MGLPIIDLCLRGLNTAFLVISLGLSASLIATQDNSHSRVNMALFASIFGLVFSSFYAVFATFISVFAWPAIMVSVDFLNFVFTFSAATALAVGIGAKSCTNQTHIEENAIIEDSKSRCRKAQATVAFLYFSFFIFLVNLGFSVFSLVNGGAFGFTKSGGKASQGLPSVAQV